MSGSDAPRDRRVLHNIRNQLSVIIGYCDLLLGDTAGTDRMRSDIMEMRKAAEIAITHLDELRERE